MKKQRRIFDGIGTLADGGAKYPHDSISGSPDLRTTIVVRRFLILTETVSVIKII